VTSKTIFIVSIMSAVRFSPQDLRHHTGPSKYTAETQPTPHLNVLSILRKRSGSFSGRADDNPVDRHSMLAGAAMSE